MPDTTSEPPVDLPAPSLTTRLLDASERMAAVGERVTAALAQVAEDNRTSLAEVRAFAKEDATYHAKGTAVMEGLREDIKALTAQIQRGEDRKDREETRTDARWSTVGGALKAVWSVPAVQMVIVLVVASIFHVVDKVSFP